MPPMERMTLWISRMRRTASSTSAAVSSRSAFSSPASEAQVPEMRQSPVLGFSWNGRPRAKLPGKRPV